MNDIITIILASISIGLLGYNLLLGRKLDQEKQKDIKEIEDKIKESKNETKKLVTNLTTLIKQYRKLRRSNDSDENRD